MTGLERAATRDGAHARDHRPVEPATGRMLGITGLSKSQVSVMAKELDAAVEAFRTRPLDAGPYTFVAADALSSRSANRGGWSMCRLVDVSAVADRQRPVRGPVADLRCPRGTVGGDRHYPAGRVLAAVPHPLRRCRGYADMGGCVPDTGVGGLVKSP